MLENPREERKQLTKYEIRGAKTLEYHAYFPLRIFEQKGACSQSND